MSFTPWSDAYDLRFPVAWWDAEGDVVTVDAVGVVRLRTTDAGASYVLFVSVPTGAATVPPDGTHTLGGVAGYRVQVNDQGDGSGPWSNYSTGGYANGWLQNTVPRRFANSTSILPNGGSPGAVRVQVLTPTPAGTPTGDVLAEVTKTSAGGAFVTVGEDVGPRVVTRAVVYPIVWRNGGLFDPGAPTETVQSVVSQTMTSYKGVMFVKFKNDTGPPEPTGWVNWYANSQWEWFPDAGASSGNLGESTRQFQLDSFAFNQAQVPGFSGTGLRGKSALYGLNAPVVVNSADVFYDGEFDVTAGQYFVPLELEVPPVQTRPLVAVRLSTRNAVDGGTP